MRYSLDHNKLFVLLEHGLSNHDFMQFQRDLSWEMHKSKPIWLPVKRKPQDLIDTIIKILTVEPYASAPSWLMLLLSNLTSHSPSSSSKSGKLASSIAKPDAASVPKATKRSAKKAKASNRVPETVGTATDSTKPSRKTVRKLKFALQTDVQIAGCKIPSCKSCLMMKTNVPVTRCTHPNPHPSGWFVHVPRKISKRYHATGNKDLLTSITGSCNPLLETPVARMTSSGPGIAQLGSDYHDIVMGQPKVVEKTRSVTNTAYLQTSNKQTTFSLVSDRSESTTTRDDLSSISGERIQPKRARRSPVIYPTSQLHSSAALDRASAWSAGNAHDLMD